METDRLHTIVCEFCDEQIAKTHLPDLKRPLTADMFKSLGSGYLEPFFPTEWLWMQCPFCRNRPFMVDEEQAEKYARGVWPGPERVRTTEGWYTIGSNEYPGEPVEPPQPVKRGPGRPRNVDRVAT